MSDSFQKEVPKARINLSLNVETGGNAKKLELPLKMLVMGDFSNGKTKGKVVDRERVNINKNNFEAVMKDLNPTTGFEVPNQLAQDGSDISVKLSFTSMNDFRPDHVAQQIPELHSLMAMRNLLKDLKSNLLDNAKFRKELERIVANQPQLEGLKQQLESLLVDSKEASSMEIRSF